MATIAPSCSALIKVIWGSSTNASKKGAAPEEGLKKICPTPDAFSCATSSAPPVPCTFRDADDPDGGFAAASSAAAGRNGASDCAMEFAAAAVTPRVPKPESSCLRDIRLSRYCLIRCFIAFLPLPSERSSELDDAEFRLDLCSAHRTPQGALIQRICGPNGPTGLPSPEIVAKGFMFDWKEGFGTTGNRTLV